MELRQGEVSPCLVILATKHARSSTINSELHFFSNKTLPFSASSVVFNVTSESYFSSAGVRWASQRDQADLESVTLINKSDERTYKDAYQQEMARATDKS